MGEAERAGRHYRLVEPENRLVARQLALEWEDKLVQQQSLREDKSALLLSATSFTHRFRACGNSSIISRYSSFMAGSNYNKCTT
jgi:hypothetical protein